jgi:6-pyruvoyltetrahydropterin/6-carboxytetrahydropterin synthase
MVKTKQYQTLHLYKQNFKFSAAHFLIFDEERAEKLHGHNYQVQVDLMVPKESELMNHGYFIDFKLFKEFIKQRLDHWDEHVLLPIDHPDIKAKVEGPSLQVHFRDRFYVFPKNEVVLLQITNTSVEQLSEILANDFLYEFSKYGVEKIRVRVEETRGQGASTVVRS